MKQTSLRSVTLKTIENYRHAAEQAVEAYRASGHRLIRAVDRSLDRSLYTPAEKLVPRVSQRLQSARSRMADLANQSIDRVSANTGKVIDFGSTTATTQVTRAAERVDQIDNQVVAGGLKAAARVSLVGAKVALALSTRLADGADMLSSAAAGHALPTTKATAKAAVKRVARKVSAKVKAAPAKVKAEALRAEVAAKKVRAAAQPAPRKRAARKTAVAASA